MTTMELLDGLAFVKEEYILEAHSSDISQDKIVSISRMSRKRRIMLVALVAVMLMLMGCAVVYMKLQELKIGEYTQQNPYIQNGTDVTGDVISGQGFEGSKNYQAVKEWNDFYDSCDIKAALEDDYIAPIDYMAYSCYTQEMKDKIDEICAKYELELLGPIYTDTFGFLTMYEYDWQRTMGTGKLFNEEKRVTAVIDYAYYFRGGTFQFYGITEMNYKKSPWKYPVGYQYRCSSKAAFDEVSQVVYNLDEYEQWSYTLSDGSDALLALGDERALIIVDKESHFISINVLDVWAEDEVKGWQKMDKKTLEALTDTFDFTYNLVKPNECLMAEPEYFEEEGIEE